MMLRRAAVKLLGALSLLAAVGVSENANATETIKIGKPGRSRRISCESANQIGRAHV